MEKYIDIPKVLSTIMAILCMIILYYVDSWFQNKK